MTKVDLRQISINHIAINNDVDHILFDSWPLPRKLCFILNIDRALKTMFTEMQTCTEF